MTTNPNLELAQTLAKKVSDLYSIYMEKKKVSDEITNGTTLFPAWDNWNLSLVELQRQYDYHVSKGNTNAANGVLPYLTAVKASEVKAVTITDQAKSNYDQALADYQKIAGSLLTPSEKAELDAQLKPTEPNYATGNTKYWIVGGIILVVIVIGIVFFVFKKNKAE